LKKFTWLVFLSVMIGSGLIGVEGARFKGSKPLARVDDPDPKFELDPVNAVPGEYLVTFDDGLGDDAGYTPDPLPSEGPISSPPSGLGMSTSSTTEPPLETTVDDGWVNTGEEPTVSSAVTMANSIASTYLVTPQNVYDSVGVFRVSMSEATARAMSHDSRVIWVESDSVGGGSGDQAIPAYVGGPDSWGLDRVDQRSVTRDHHFHYTNTGTGVHAYIIDSGINIDHPEFGGRATWDYSAISSESPDDKYRGHGTEVASVLGGSICGSAKNVYLHSVKAWGKNGTLTSNAVSAINWVRKHAIKPAVVNCSLWYTKPTWIQHLAYNTGGVERAWRRLVGSGVTCFTCANNKYDNTDNYVPSGTAAGITVSATDVSDAKPNYACYGAGIDLFAPGDNVSVGFWYRTTSSGPRINGYGIDSGTSFSSPLAAGVGVLYLQSHPTATPAAVLQWLKDNCTTNAISLGNSNATTPNRLLYTNQ
jgi:subtilisin family serine protease